MWIMTDLGFFGSVEKPGGRTADRPTIRARVPGDLEALRAAVPPDLGATVERGRTIIPIGRPRHASALAVALANMAPKLDHANFSDAVKSRQWAARAILPPGGRRCARAPNHDKAGRPGHKR
jgi:hypothetical protein